MPSQTVRHLVVVAICCAGVASLYLLPEPSRVGSPRANPQAGQRPPTATTLAQSSVSATTPVETVTPRDRTTVVYDPEEPVDTSTPRASEPASPTPSSTPGSTGTRPAARPSTSVTASASRSTASRPAPTGSASVSSSAAATEIPRDTTRPAQVTDVAVLARTFDRLSLRWAAASDDVAVDHYEVFLNGYRVDVERIELTSAVVPWLEDSSSEFVLTVRAVDRSGNAGHPSDRIPVARPEPVPSSPTPSASPAIGQPSSTATGPESDPSPEGNR